MLCYGLSTKTNHTMALQNEIIWCAQTGLIIASIQAAKQFKQAGLVALMILLSLLANVFVLLPIHLFGIEVTCADPYAIGAIIILNHLRDQYGAKFTRKCILQSILCLYFSCLCMFFFLCYQPSNLSEFTITYRKIIEELCFVMSLSAAIFTLIEGIDPALYHLSGRWISHQWPVCRVLIVVILTQCIDTYLFTWLALGNHFQFWPVFAWSYGVKIITSIIMVPLSYVKLNWQHPKQKHVFVWNPSSISQI